MKLPFRKKLKYTVIQYVKGVFDAVKTLMLRSGKETIGVGGFERVYNVFAVVSWIIYNVSTLPYKLCRFKGDEIEEVRDHPVKHTLLKNPNSLNSGKDLIEANTAYLLLDGNSYLLNSGSIQRPVELWNLFAQDMDPKPGGIGNPIAYYDYTPSNAPHRTFQPEEIIHERMFNPRSMIKGMSVVDVARSIINIQNAMEQWNQSILDNMGKPEGAWTYEGDLGVTQKKELLKMVKEAHKRYELKGETLVMGGGLKWIPFALKPIDLDWIAGDELSLRKICAVLRFPPELLGDAKNKTYSNMQEAHKAVYINTIIPLGEKHCDTWNRYFFPDGQYFFMVNKKEVEVIQKALGEQVTALKDAWWLTPKRRCELMGEVPYDHPNMEKVWMPIGYQPIDDIEGMPAGDFE